MIKINLLSLFLAFIFICCIFQKEVDAASRTNRRLNDSAFPCYRQRRSLMVLFFCDQEKGGYQKFLQNGLRERRFRSSLSAADIELLNALRKRQIRYHPCYFNPVSCFKRK
ncbi:uncharacterized protein [Parasteatoda tepidariorum]|nr:uncharacterized protein LOC107440330 [Parasteatoda tepidariorum]